MTISFPTILSALRSFSASARTVYWGHCPHCERTTPWQVNVLRGEYRCTECRHSPFEAEA